jgi:hypothetical protein
MRPYLLILPLIAILGVVLWFVYWAWTAIEAPPIPAIGYWAIGGGVTMSLLVGIGLMALLFYSERHGYDDNQDRSRRQRKD